MMIFFFGWYKYGRAMVSGRFSLKTNPMNDWGFDYETCQDSALQCMQSRQGTGQLPGFVQWDPKESLDNYGNYLVAHPTARKWVITPVISGLSLLIPFITGVITHLLSGMSHQVLENYGIESWDNNGSMIIIR